MSNPYYWNFPNRADTMYMATIQNKSSSFARESSFQKRDIQGTSPRQLVPEKVYRANYSNSAWVEPRPEYSKSINKISDPLKRDDIEGTYPNAVDFRTNRVVNPLMPRYELPSHLPIDVEPPRPFLRNTLDVTDIAKKKQFGRRVSNSKEGPIQGSSPSKLFKTIEAVSRLNVKDINEDGKFTTQRKMAPTDPLKPVYNWRDSIEGATFSFTKPVFEQQTKNLNHNYGEINGSKPKQLIKSQSTQKSSLDVKDIQGAHANSSVESRYFMDKRRDFRNYMKNDDIEKTHASSLRKGIDTKRVVNPLMPNYKFI